MPRFNGTPVDPVQEEKRGGRFGGRLVQDSPRADFSDVRSKVETTETGPRGRTAGERAKHDLGLSFRNVVEGTGDLVGFVADPFIHAYNWAGEKGPTQKSLITGVPERRWEPQATTREGWGQLLDKFGVPRAETASERVQADVGRALTSTGLTLGIGGLLGQGSRLGQFLTTAPTTQVVGSAMGSGAAGTTREMGGGPGAQLTAGLVGSMAPSVGLPAMAEGTRRLVRGGEVGREGVLKTLADFAQVGATPSVGQATQGRAARGLESLLSGGPTSAGVLGDFAERQQGQMQSGLARMAEGMSRNASAERAGRAVERGVDAFAENTRATRSRLYTEADQLIPPQTSVPMRHTLSALDELTAIPSGAKATGAALVNKEISNLAQRIRKDMSASRNAGPFAGLMQGAGGMDYQTVRNIRTAIGRELTDFALSVDRPTAQYKQLYAALSRDLEDAAKGQGPHAEQAMRRANTYFRASAERLEALERVVDRNGGPEKVFNAVMSGTADGGTTLRKVMQSLDGEGQQAITAAVIKRMGLEGAGAQNAAGDAFSSHRFLSNWNKLSGEAKKALFDRYGPQFSKDMDRLARVAENLKDGSKVYANPSGSGNRVAGFAYWGTLAAAVLSGNLAGAGLTLGGGASANALARAMTNPRFVHWLAGATELPSGAIATQLPILRAIAEDDPDVAEIADSLDDRTKTR